MTRRGAIVFLWAIAAAAVAQTRGAVVTKLVQPVYPDGALKGQRQGNVVLIGRIDTNGRIQDVRYVQGTLQAFVEPAIAAVKEWELRPALRNGKPVEIAANIGMRYRLQSEKHGEIPAPLLGDLPVYPADTAGHRKAPEGFPIHRGVDPRVLVDSVLDVPPLPKARKLTVSVQAISPKGRHIPLFEDSVSVPPKATEVKVPFTANVGADWEDGVWLLRFKVDQADAGGGQFWLAGDPEHFHFVVPGTDYQAPPAAAPPSQPRPSPSPAAPRRSIKKV